MKHRSWLAGVVVCALAWTWAGEIVRAAAPTGADEAVRDEVLLHLQGASEAGIRALLHDASQKDREAFTSFYDQTATSGRWAVRHELEKVAYFREWAAKRNMVFRDAEVKLLPWRVRASGDLATVYFSQSIQLGYTYGDEGQDAVVNHFGIGTRHSAQLVRREGRWLIKRDWYTSPMGEPGITPALAPIVDPLRTARAWWEWLTEPGEGRIRSAMRQPPPEDPGDSGLPVARAARKRYDRGAAAAYADRYCGDAWGCGNDHRYHRARYRDYDGIGGDCTNFISQVLGPDGGGLRMDGSWYYHGVGASGSGSTAWVQAGALARYLVYSGRGSLIARGRFQELTRPSARHPDGAVRKLEKGDVIAYNESGRRVDHLSVVTAFDTRGYPMVNSHTADRYHVPWDLGWDARTTYSLIHIRD